MFPPCKSLWQNTTGEFTCSTHFLAKKDIYYRLHFYEENWKILEPLDFLGKIDVQQPRGTISFARIQYVIQGNSGEGLVPPKNIVATLYCKLKCWAILPITLRTFPSFWKSTSGRYLWGRRACEFGQFFAPSLSWKPSFSIEHSIRIWPVK